MKKRTIEISEETYQKIKAQLSSDEDVDISSLNDLVGKDFFFRLVTYHMLGRVEKVTGKLIELSGASWVADSGRFTDAIKKGTLKEVEPVGQWWINIDTCTDFGPWKHPLPTEQK